MLSLSAAVAVRGAVKYSGSISGWVLGTHMGSLGNWANCVDNGQVFIIEERRKRVCEEGECGGWLQAQKCQTRFWPSVAAVWRPPLRVVHFFAKRDISGVMYASQGPLFCR